MTNCALIVNISGCLENQMIIFHKCFLVKSFGKRQEKLTIFGSSLSPLENVTAIVLEHFSPYHGNIPRDVTLPVFNIKIR